MTVVDIRDIIAWQVQKTTASTRVVNLLQGALTIADTIATLGATASAGRSRVSYHFDSASRQVLPLGQITASGGGWWLPVAAGQSYLLKATTAEVFAVSETDSQSIAKLPIERLSLDSAECLSRATYKKQAHIKWRVVTVGTDDAGTSHSMTITAAWLSLAWLGLLGAWPEPA